MIKEPAEKHSTAKKAIGLFFIFFTFFSYGQGAVGIGTNDPDPGAILDVSSENKGLLIPRVNGISQVAGGNAAEGTIVYDSAGGNKTLSVKTKSGWETYFRQVDGDALVDKVDANAEFLVPEGGIIMWSGATPPIGWALCDGLWYNPDDGSSSITQTATHTVQSPDLRGRFVVGTGQNGNPAAGDNNYNYSLNTSGGRNSVSLTTAQMPSHDHTATINQSGDHYHQAASLWTGNTTYANTDLTTANEKISANPASSYRLKRELRVSDAEWVGRTSNDGEHTHTIQINASGSNNSHENRPPYYVLAFIIKL